MTTEPRAETGRVRQRISRPGLELIKSFEGFRRKSARLPGGRYVVGYGHIRSAREGVEVSEADAEALLRYDLLPVEAAVNEWTFAPLTQNQFDALCSFAFSIGVKTFRRSDVLRRINEGAMLQAAAALDMWRRVELDGEGVIVDALVRRRAAEKALFLQPADGHVPAPSAVLKSSIDFAAYRSVPRRRPEQIATPLEGPEAVAVRPASEPAEADQSPAKLAAANVSARLSELLVEEDDLPVTDAAPEDVPEDEPLDGDFLQAPPSPPESLDDLADAPDETFPELDLQSEPQPAAIDDLEAALLEMKALSAATEAPAESLTLSEPEPDAPIVELPELPPFPQDGAVEIEPAAQETFDEQFESEPGPAPSVGAFPQSTVGPSAGDPSALAEPVDGPNNEPFLYLFLAGLALLIASAVLFFRTPEPGGDAGGVGWLVIGLAGLAGITGSLWAIMGRGENSHDEEAPR
jgi:lysozyme